MHFNLLRKTSFTLFLIAICISGYAQVSSFEHYQIDINGKRHDFFEFVEHVEIIPLEETKQSLLPRVEFYYKLSNGFAIRDYNTKSLVLFDTNGRFVTAINKFGEGPEEYKEISSAWERDGKVELYSGLSKSLSQFTMEGKYIRTIPAKYEKSIAGGSMIPFNEGYLLHMLDPAPNKQATLSLILLNRDLELIKAIPSKGKSHPFPVNLGKRFRRLNNQVLYKKVLNDSLFIFKNNKLLPWMKFDFMGDWAWSDPRNTASSKAASAIVLENEKVIEVLPDVGEHLIILSYFQGLRNPQYGFIDRASKKFNRLDLRKSDKQNFEIKFMEWEGDYLVSSLQSYDLEEFLENLDDDQYSIAGGLKYEDFAFSENPVLLRIKLKTPS